MGQSEAPMAVYEEGFAPTAEAPRLSNLMNVAGAAISLALIVGVGVWGYKLVVRDVSGIPVVRAMEGDMRVLPDNPGGEVALHTGLSVNEVAAIGEAGGPEDRLVLAPSTPALAEEDLTAQLSPQVTDLLESDAAPAVDLAATATDALAAPAEELDEIALLTQMLVAGTGPSNAPPAAEVIAASVPGVKASLRPILRPAVVRPVQISASQPAVQSVTEVAVSTAPLPAGTHLVHLGAFESPADAAQAWQRLDQRLGQYMGGYERIIQVSNQSSGTWYRLRAKGFADRSEARRLCAVLQAENAECITVVTN